MSRLTAAVSLPIAFFVAAYVGFLSYADAGLLAPKRIPLPPLQMPQDNRCCGNIAVEPAEEPTAEPPIEFPEAYSGDSAIPITMPISGFWVSRVG